MASDKPKKLKRYMVLVPIAGRMAIEVEAPEGASHEELFGAAVDRYGDDESAGEVEWDFYLEIARGSVLSVPHASVEATEIDDE